MSYRYHVRDARPRWTYALEVLALGVALVALCAWAAITFAGVWR